ncbi:MAG: 2Fe-2S iron-sulfur cluster binding domain-containing protein [bacterium]|nr:2Fe-2S iron-sulfur cluster binding domain-containing protein [bacterium]
MAKITYKDEHGKVIEIPVDSNKSILEMLEAEGIDYPFSCMAGACSSCKITCKSGKDKVQLDKFGTPMMPVEDNEFLSCIAGIADDTAADEGTVIELEKAEE